MSCETYLILPEPANEAEARELLVTRCVYDSLTRGEGPITSAFYRHFIFQGLVPADASSMASVERIVEAQIAAADKVVAYVTPSGFTPRMQHEADVAARRGLVVEVRPVPGLER